MKIPLFRYLSVTFIISCASFISCEKDDPEVNKKISIEVISPADGSTVEGTVDIDYTLTRERNLDRVDVFIDHVLNASYPGIPENIQLNTSPYTNGVHILTLLAAYTFEADNETLEKRYWSEPIMLNIQNPVIIVPSVPSLHAVSNFENSVTLSWDENLQPVTGYRVKRKLNENEFVTLAELSADALTFVDDEIEFDIANRYSYIVEAYTETASTHSNNVSLSYRTVAYEEYRSFDVPETAEGKIAITPDTDKIVITNYFENTFTVISSDDGSTISLEHAGGTMGLGISNDGTLIAVQGTHDTWVDVWNLQTLTRSNQINTHDNGFEVAMNNAGSKLVLGNSIKSIESATGNLIKDWGAGHSITRSISFSDNEALLLTAGNDNLVKLWNSETGTLIKAFTGHTGHVGSSRFIDYETGVISGSYEDKTVRLWDIESGELEDIIPFKSGIVGIVNLKGHNLVIATEEGAIFLSNEHVSSTKEFGKSLRLFSIAYSSDTEIIAAYYQQKVVLYKPSEKNWEIDL